MHPAGDFGPAADESGESRTPRKTRGVLRGTEIAPRATAETRNPEMTEGEKAMAYLARNSASAIKALAALYDGERRPGRPWWSGAVAREVFTQELPEASEKAIDWLMLMFETLKSELGYKAIEWDVTHSLLPILAGLGFEWPYKEQMNVTPRLKR